MGKYPTDPEEVYLVEALCAHIYAHQWRPKGEQIPEEYFRNIAEKEAPQMLKFISERTAANIEKTNYLVGNGLTPADCMAMSFFTYYFFHPDMEPIMLDALRAFPALWKYTQHHCSTNPYFQSRLTSPLVHTIGKKLAREFRLKYFNVNGLGIFSRVALGVTGSDFCEQVISPFEEWMKYGFYKKLTPLGKVPTLHHRDHRGQELVQSRAIVRYIMQVKGHYPTSPEEAYEAEAIVDTMADLTRALKPG